MKVKEFKELVNSLPDTDKICDLDLSIFINAPKQGPFLISKKDIILAINMNDLSYQIEPKQKITFHVNEFKNSNNFVCLYENGNFYLEGIFFSYDIFDEYCSKEEFEKHFNKLFNKINKGKLIGEIGPVDCLDISLQNVSHEIKHLAVEAKFSKKPYLYGKIRLLNTDKGRLAANLIFIEKRKFSVIPRLTYSVENNKIIINDLFTFDLIIE